MHEYRDKLRKAARTIYIARERRRQGDIAGYNKGLTSAYKILHSLPLDIQIRMGGTFIQRTLGEAYCYIDKKLQVE